MAARYQCINSEQFTVYIKQLLGQQIIRPRAWNPPGHAIIKLELHIQIKVSHCHSITPISSVSEILISSNLYQRATPTNGLS